jgi:hypothetical protein
MRKNIKDKLQIAPNFSNKIVQKHFKIRKRIFFVKAVASKTNMHLIEKPIKEIDKKRITSLV